MLNWTYIYSTEILEFTASYIKYTPFICSMVHIYLNLPILRNDWHIASRTTGISPSPTATAWDSTRVEPTLKDNLQFLSEDSLRKCGPRISIKETPLMGNDYALKRYSLKTNFIYYHGCKSEETIFFYLKMCLIICFIPSLIRAVYSPSALKIYIDYPSY